MDDASPETGFEAVQAVHRMIRVFGGGNSEEVVIDASPLPGPLHPRPLKGVGGHKVPLPVRGCSVEVGPPGAEGGHDVAREELIFVVGEDEGEAGSGPFPFGALFGPGTPELRGDPELPAVILPGMNGDFVPFGGFSIQLIPAAEILRHPVGIGRGDFDGYPFLRGEPDIIAGLRLHPGEEGVRVRRYIDNNRRRGLDILHRLQEEPPGLLCRGPAGARGIEPEKTAPPRQVRCELRRQRLEEEGRGAPFRSGTAAGRGYRKLGHIRTVGNVGEGVAAREGADQYQEGVVAVLTAQDEPEGFLAELRFKAPPVSRLQEVSRRGKLFDRDRFQGIGEVG